MWLLLTSGLSQASGLVGVDWVPPGRADQAVVAAGDLTGTGLGEFDGVLRPPLTAWAGWRTDQVAVLWGLSAGWSRTARYVGESKTISSRGGVRPSLDVRRYLSDQGPVSPWLQGGLYGTVPWARESSTLYTDEEADAMADLAAEERGRIAGYGVRLGAGAELSVGDSLLLGARWLTVVHQGIVNSEDGITVSTQMFPEVALTVGWRL